jgi:hypothetical protein
VLLGNGDGSFQAATSYAVGSFPYSVAVGDFNGDGLPDLAVQGAGGVRILLGNGDGTFRTSPVSYIAGIAPTSVAVGDFNGDGSPDLAVANHYSNDVSILLNDGNWGRRSPGRSDGTRQRESRAAGAATSPLPAVLPSSLLATDPVPGPLAAPPAARENAPEPAAVAMLASPPLATPHAQGMLERVFAAPLDAGRTSAWRGWPLAAEFDGPVAPLPGPAWNWLGPWDQP